MDIRLILVAEQAAPQVAQVKSLCSRTRGSDEPTRGSQALNRADAGRVLLKKTAWVTCFYRRSQRAFSYFT
jgi:hypothetical protein